MTDLSALTAALDLLVDAGKDTMSAQGNALQRITAYENLVPDLMALVPKIGDIPEEAKALKPEDYMSLTKHVVERLAVSDAHAQGVIDASINLLNDLVTYIVPDVTALLAAIKKP